MPSSLTVTTHVALWVVLRVVYGSLGPQCDNGKLSLEKDLPVSAVDWDCPETPWLGSTQRPPSVIDTWYDPEPARQTCMDESISYTRSVPHSGAFRPVRAESGEYVYCPPQRWLNNLHNAAVVFLYHPCAPRHERLLLSALARSCLSDYIITPHKELSTHTPVVLVSWGRTLELSTSATLEVCDWLQKTTSTRNQSAASSRSRNYNLLLTWSAETHRRSSARPEEQPANTKEPLRRCCERTIISLLNGVIEPQVQITHIQREKHFRDKGKIRLSRASVRKQRNTIDEDEKENTACVSRSLSSQTNRTLTDNVQNYNCTYRSLKGSASENRTLLDVPETAFRIDSLTSGHAEFKEVQRNKQKGTRKLQHVERRSPVSLDLVAGSVDGEHNQTTKPENASISSNKLRRKDSAKLPVEENKHHEKSSGKNTTSTKHAVDANALEVKEREVKQQRPQTASDPPSHHGCDTCTEKSGSRENAAPVNQGFSRFPRNDEALWAAAALGFLLVLLTLSVLHTRLYRNWRTSPSLYWRDPKEDYDTVADVIRRRIQIAKRRLKRGRRKECVFIQSSSSSDENL